MIDDHILLARQLISRLERLSADSYWAHRASGLRGSLLRCLDGVEREPSPEGLAHLDALVQQGFTILVRAAQEIRVPPREGDFR